MKKFLTVIAVIALASCSKDKQVTPQALKRTDFFSNEQEAAQKIQAAFVRNHVNEKLAKIESISYMDGKDKSYAVIFFTTDKRTRNLIVEKGYGKGNVQMKATTCEGRDCDCKVVTVIGNHGEVSVDCSCKSCSMVIDNFDTDFE